MGDDSRSRSMVGTLKNEWSLLMDMFQGEDLEAKDAFETGKLEVLSLNQIRSMTKALSEDRKKINQRLESLNKELDLNAAKLESLRLGGQDHEQTLSRIHELTDLGQNLSEALDKLDSRLKEARQKEEELREDFVES